VERKEHLSKLRVNKSHCSIILSGKGQNERKRNKQRRRERIPSLDPSAKGRGHYNPLSGLKG